MPSHPNALKWGQDSISSPAFQPIVEFVCMLELYGLKVLLIADALSKTIRENSLELLESILILQ